MRDQSSTRRASWEWPSSARKKCGIWLVRTDSRAGPQAGLPPSLRSHGLELLGFANQRIAGGSKFQAVELRGETILVGRTGSCSQTLAQFCSFFIACTAAANL